MPNRVSIPETVVTHPAREWWLCIGALHRHQTEAAANECEGKLTARQRSIVRTAAEDGHYYLSGYDLRGRFEGRHAVGCCDWGNQ